MIFLMETQTWREQMKIEIAEPGRMTQSGSSLLRLIQNNKTPILDLLVRESVQNSLDAHKEGAKSVTVEFLTGDFKQKELSTELEKITEELNKRYPEETCRYLAICDSDTVGLTGEMDVQQVKGNNYGNLLKLVYEICKPQEAEGAGGSWGLGKTIYFRIGIGLVIYYSRILDENGIYSSRLAASYVEDETNPNAMLPEYKGMTRRGIAWWGDRIRENTTVPVTNEEYIVQFLDIFGVKPYDGDKTGTMIIIPYIDEETLLAHNKIDHSDSLGEGNSPFWYSSVEEYLKIAVQRWYAPRLVNPKYPYGAFLKVLVNGNGISADSMQPIFKTVQALYNRANHVTEEDFLADEEAEVTVGEAVIFKYLKNKVAGNIACTKLPRKTLRMEVPDNKPEPAVYFNCEVTDKTANRPFVFYVRQPGMIVSYESVSNWTAGIASTNVNDYILGIFVLDSANYFVVQDSPVNKLEEYIRKSEMADHTSWNDWTKDHFNPRIVSKIQRSVTKIIGDKYAAEKTEHQPRENSELGMYLGGLILPPDGFGKAPNIAPKPPAPDGKKNISKAAFFVVQDEIRYKADVMTIPLVLKTKSNKKLRHTAFEMQIESEVGKISFLEWENKVGLIAPFSIDEVEILIDTIDSQKKGEAIAVSANDSKALYGDTEFKLRATPAGVVYGLDITSEEERSMYMEITIKVRLVEKNVRPAFVFEKEGR